MYLTLSGFHGTRKIEKSGSLIYDFLTRMSYLEIHEHSLLSPIIIIQRPDPNTTTSHFIL